MLKLSVDNHMYTLIYIQSLYHTAYIYIYIYIYIDVQYISNLIYIQSYYIIHY